MTTSIQSIPSVVPSVDAGFNPMDTSSKVGHSGPAPRAAAAERRIYAQPQIKESALIQGGKGQTTIGLAAIEVGRSGRAPRAAGVWQVDAEPQRPMSFAMEARSNGILLEKAVAELAAILDTGTKSLGPQAAQSIQRGFARTVFQDWTTKELLEKRNSSEIPQLWRREAQAVLAERLAGRHMRTFMERFGTTTTNHTDFRGVVEGLWGAGQEMGIRDLTSGLFDRLSPTEISALDKGIEKRFEQLSDSKSSRAARMRFDYTALAIAYCAAETPAEKFSFLMGLFEREAIARQGKTTQANPSKHLSQAA
jgi:hypothetical protein